MGLDFTIGLRKTNLSSQTDFSKFNIDKNFDIFLNLKDIKISDDNMAISKYYRLNWPGVRYEKKFSRFFCGHYLKTKAEFNSELTTLKRAKKEKVKFVLLTGQTKPKWSNEYQDVYDILPLKNIRRAKGNLLKVRQRFGEDYFVSKAKIYAPNKVHTMYPIFDLVALGCWTGSNGEGFVLKHTNDDSINISEQEFVYDDDDNETVESEKELFKLSIEQYSALQKEVERSITILMFYLKKDVNNEYGDHYIASNNLTLLVLMQEFFNDKNTEMTVYFG